MTVFPAAFSSLSEYSVPLESYAVSLVKHCLLLDLLGLPYYDQGNDAFSCVYFYGHENIAEKTLFL